MTSTLTLLKKPICPQHGQIYIHYCAYPPCCQNKTRLCPKCLPQHKEHEKYIVKKQQVIIDLQSGLQKCFQKLIQYDTRSKQLSKIMNEIKGKVKYEYEVMQSSLVDEMRKDKQLMEEKVIRMESLLKEINDKQRLGRYFTRMKEQNLLHLRIKLSSADGIRNFRQKNDKFCVSMQRSNLDSLQKIHEQFNKLLSQFNNQMVNNSTFKLGQLIALKNSKRERQHVNVQNGKNQGQFTIKKIENKQNNRHNNNKIGYHQNALLNKQKQKPKTQTNFGEVILGGILRFFNR